MFNEWEIAVKEICEILKIPKSEFKVGAFYHNVAEKIEDKIGIYLIHKDIYFVNKVLETLKEVDATIKIDPEEVLDLKYGKDFADRIRSWFE